MSEEPDAIFSNRRLAEIYDFFDGERSDLEPYIEIAQGFGVQSVLDVGCGTGNFANFLSQKGLDVVGVDPAEESLRIARVKNRDIKFIAGEVGSISDVTVDIVFMTGNVAQIFLCDNHWEDTLKNIEAVLKDGGHLVFEVRDPSQKDWENWTPEKTFQSIDIPQIGVVEGWCEVLDVKQDFVNFMWTYKFKSDDEILRSESTLRFRSKENIIKSLKNVGYEICDIRDAPDRPQKEFVFIVKKRGAP